MVHGVAVGVSKAISCGTITTSSLVTTINEHRQMCYTGDTNVFLKTLTRSCVPPQFEMSSLTRHVLPEYLGGGSTNRPSPARGEF